MKLPLHIICFLLYLAKASLLAQVSQSKINPDSIKQVLEKSAESFSKLTKEETEKGIHLLEQAEKLADRLNDPYSKILVNRDKLSFFFNNNDTISIEKYLTKNLDIIKQLGDKRQLGLYYEDVGVYNASQGKEKEAHYAMLIAEKLLSEYGEIEDAIDVNYNLCLQYLRKENWDSSIEHCLKSIDAIIATGIKQNRQKNLYLFLARNYINLGKFEKAEKCFENIEKDEAAFDDPHFKGKYFSVKGFFYDGIKDYKKAAFYYNKSSKSFYEYHSKRTKEVSASLILSSQLDLQKEENKRIKIENELKMQGLKNRGYIISLGVLIIFGLIILSVIQYRVSRYKTNINKLLKRNNEQLVGANQKVDKALEIKSEFLDSVTHELLTPLNTIKGTTFLLQKEKLTTHQVNQIKLINVSSDYLLNLINDVIQLNDLEKENLELRNEEFDLKSLLNNLIDSSLMMKNNGNEIHRKIDSDIPSILKGDMLKISRIILNILDNALKFTRNGNIYIKVSLISTSNNNAKVKFSIQDTGIGMTEEQIHNAFEAFHQGSVRINREYGGTGLGLSIVKRMLKLLNSNIVLKSKPKEGTLVTFIIDFDIPEPIKEENILFENDSNQLQENINVLLVEDNKVNQLITKKIISNYGFCCDSAYDGIEAVDMVKENEYSMVLMDIMMPKMDGFEATTNIREFNNQIPIVALTALSEKLNKERFDEVGIFKILQKPVNPKQLYEVLVDCSKR
ncbi:response regulator [Aquimarina sp. MAR_2010_214]|uniref:response regulator n=1 Tax=Aquimarina sp. MAR_2010_214 TaxID=1250026 RepID=UPI001E61C076|nr:response regulator [Aquimarina sp. MAR_2010_214]